MKFSSTWRCWLSNFGFGWGFLRWAGVCFVAGAAERRTAKMVNLGFLLFADIRVLPEPLWSTPPHPSWGTKETQKQSPRRTQAHWLFLGGPVVRKERRLASSFPGCACCFWELSLTSPLLFVAIPHDSQPYPCRLRVSASLEPRSHSQRHFMALLGPSS